MVELSVVLITKNQAWNISRLIESVLDATSCVSSREIIVVDSASADETVEIAKPYPVGIVGLAPNQRLSPAIGRYVGYKQTHGEYVLFLDGDTRLFSGWLPRALHVMRETPNAGAITGKVINLPTSAAADTSSCFADPFPPMNAPREVLWGSYGGGGAAMYRRSVLERVGTFNPGLYGDEEPELGFRIRHAGYHIYELDCPVVTHYNDTPVSFITPLERRKRNFHLGAGQAARYHSGTKLFWSWLKERPWGLGAALIYAWGAGSLLGGLVTRDFRWFAIWAVGFCLLVGYVSLKKRSIRGAVVSVFYWMVLAEGFVKGFVRKAVPIDDFHPKVDLIRNFKDQCAASRLGRDAAHLA